MHQQAQRCQGEGASSGGALSVLGRGRGGRSGPSFPPWALCVHPEPWSCVECVVAWPLPLGMWDPVHHPPVHLHQHTTQTHHHMHCRPNTTPTPHHINHVIITRHVHHHTSQEMMREFLERERRKQAEREAGKAEKAAAAEATPQTA